MTAYQRFKKERLEELISKYPAIRKYKESIDDLKTDTPLGKNLHTHFIEKLLKWSENFDMRKVGTVEARENGDFAGIMVHNFYLEVPGRDGTTDKFTMVDNYPVFGHEFFMTEMESIIEELGIKVAPEERFDRGDKKYCCQNFRIRFKGNGEGDNHCDTIFSNHKEFVIDQIKDNFKKHRIKELFVIDSNVEPRENITNITYKAIK
jgi:hypothetical protein